VRSNIWGIRQTFEIGVYCAQFFIIHLADRTPRHPIAIKRIAVGVNAVAQGGDEFLKLPALHHGETRSDRTDLSRHATGEIGAMTSAAVMVGENICAVFGGRRFVRRGDGASKHVYRWGVGRRPAWPALAGSTHPAGLA
jgi:hypothetical protein